MSQFAHHVEAKADALSKASRLAAPIPQFDSSRVYPLSGPIFENFFFINTVLKRDFLKMFALCTRDFTTLFSGEIVIYLENKILMRFFAIQTLIFGYLEN